MTAQHITPEQDHSVDLGRPLPEGYSVWWHEGALMFAGHGPEGWVSGYTADPYVAQRQCYQRAHDTPPTDA